MCFEEGVASMMAVCYVVVKKHVLKDRYSYIKFLYLFIVFYHNYSMCEFILYVTKIVFLMMIQ
jgi:hypothetical protein